MTGGWGGAKLLIFVVNYNIVIAYVIIMFTSLYLLRFTNP